MQQVDFYILGNQDHDAKLKYVCRLARKAYGQGMKVYLQTGDHARSVRLDTLLWTFSQSSFIPHAIVGCDRVGWDDYPVQLSENPEKIEAGVEIADILINLHQELQHLHLQYSRIAEVVCGDPADKESARNRFRSYRDQGIEPNTYRIA